MRRVLLAGSALVILAGFGAREATWLYEAPGPLERQKAVVIPRGGTVSVAAALRQAGVLSDAVEFRFFAAVTFWRGALRSAEFSFPRGASIETVLATLRMGQPVQHLLTIPEGLTAWSIGVLAADAAGLSGGVAVPIEGALLPESYAYVAGTERNSVLARAGHAMDAALAQAWRSRAAGLELRSARELLILASLIERETRLTVERPLVARVFLNRLARGMRLQSDPTVVYAESGGLGMLPGGLTRAGLDHLTPYNTYQVVGLPAGPICAPGNASIIAAAHPASSTALYFVADGRGGHVFANSLEEHNRNVERYRALAGR